MLSGLDVGVDVDVEMVGVGSLSLSLVDDMMVVVETRTWSTLDQFDQTGVNPKRADLMRLINLINSTVIDF